MAISPCTLAVLSSGDVALFERVLAKFDRYLSTGTQKTTQPPKSIVVNPAGTAALGTLASLYNFDKIGMAIGVPAGATNLYMGFQQAFGAVTASVPQYGFLLPGGTIFTFGLEYCGDIWLLNLSSSSITVDVIEIIRDESIWPS